MPDMPMPPMPTKWTGPISIGSFVAAFTAQPLKRSQISCFMPRLSLCQSLYDFRQTVCRVRSAL